MRALDLAPRWQKSASIACFSSGSLSTFEENCCRKRYHALKWRVWGVCGNTFFSTFWWTLVRFKMADLGVQKTGSDLEYKRDRVSRSCCWWLMAVILTLKSAILVVQQKTRIFSRVFAQHDTFWRYRPSMVASKRTILADSDGVKEDTISC